MVTKGIELKCEEKPWNTCPCDYEPGGRGFESCRARQYINILAADHASAVLLLGEIWVTLSDAVTRNSVLTLVPVTRFAASIS